MKRVGLSNMNGTSTASDVVIAIDLGGTNLRVAAIDTQGRILSRARRATPREAEDILSAMLVAVRECQAALSVVPAALSIAVPATIRTADNSLAQLPNIPALTNFPLVERLREALQWPIVLENDANAAALGEMWQGAGRSASTAICVTLGTGVGGGIVLQGKLWRGVDGTAGEIGHIIVEPEGVACGCGGRGCLESYASATATVRQARELVAESPSSSLHREPKLTAATIYAHAQAGDTVAQEVFRRVGYNLGLGLTSLINIFNPELIIIGGGAAAGWDAFMPHLQAEIMARAFKVPAARAQIVPALCGDDAGILGAAYLAFEQQHKQCSELRESAMV